MAFPAPSEDPPTCSVSQMNRSPRTACGAASPQTCTFFNGSYRPYSHSCTFSGRQVFFTTSSSISMYCSISVCWSILGQLAVRLHCLCAMGRQTAFLAEEHESKRKSTINICVSCTTAARNPPSLDHKISLLVIPMYRTELHNATFNKSFPL